MPVNAETFEQQASYDIIIAGAGCAGLSLLYGLITEIKLCQLRVLVIDKSLEKSNDRTWCFWETEKGPFESIVCKQWDSITVYKNNFSKQLITAPFTYKMIQGLDFYNFVIKEAKKSPNIYWQEASITNIEAIDNSAIVYWEGGSAKASKVFYIQLVNPPILNLFYGNILKDC